MGLVVVEINIIGFAIGQIIGGILGILIIKGMISFLKKERQND